MMRVLIVSALALLPAAAQDEPPKPKGFGKSWVLKVEAKSKGVQQAALQKAMKPHEESLRITGRNPAEAGKTTWELWNFQVAEGWKLDLAVFPALFGKSVQIRRFEINISGEVKADEKKVLWLTHESSGTKLRLANHPKRKADDPEPPDLLQEIEKKLAGGAKRFKVIGDVISNDGYTVQLTIAEALLPRPSEDDGK